MVRAQTNSRGQQKRRCCGRRGAPRSHSTSRSLVAAGKCSTSSCSYFFLSLFYRFYCYFVNFSFFIFLFYAFSLFFLFCFISLFYFLVSFCLFSVLCACLIQLICLFFSFCFPFSVLFLLLFFFLLFFILFSFLLAHISSPCVSFLASCHWDFSRVWWCTRCICSRVSFCCGVPACCMRRAAIRSACDMTPNTTN